MSLRTEPPTVSGEVDNNEELAKTSQESGWTAQHEKIDDAEKEPGAIEDYEHGEPVVDDHEGDGDDKAREDTKNDDAGAVDKKDLSKSHIPAPHPTMTSPYPYSYPYYFPPGTYMPPTPYGGYPTSPPRAQQADTMSSKDPITELRRNKGGVTEPFPDKLHRMLDTCEKEGLADVVSFFSHGRAFAIHKPRRFVQEVMPRFFRQTKLTSFQRQLNLYGFKRISHGPDNGGYYHESFLKGKHSLVNDMKRVKVKGIKSLVSQDPDSVPNFYIYPPINASSIPASAASPQMMSFPPPVYPAYPPFPYAPYPASSYPLPPNQGQAASSATPQGHLAPPYPGSFPYGYSPFPYPPAPVTETVPRVPQASPVQSVLSLVKTRKKETAMPKSSPSDSSPRIEGV